MFVTPTPRTLASPPKMSKQHSGVPPDKERALDSTDDGSTTHGPQSTCEHVDDPAWTDTKSSEQAASMKEPPPDLPMDSLRDLMRVKMEVVVPPAQEDFTVPTGMQEPKQGLKKAAPDAPARSSIPSGRTARIVRAQYQKLKNASGKDTKSRSLEPREGTGASSRGIVAASSCDLSRYSHDELVDYALLLAHFESEFHSHLLRNLPTDSLFELSHELAKHPLTQDLGRLRPTMDCKDKSFVEWDLGNKISVLESLLIRSRSDGASLPATVGTPCTPGQAPSEIPFLGSWLRGSHKASFMADMNYWTEPKYRSYLKDTAKRMDSSSQDMVRPLHLTCQVLDILQGSPDRATFAKQMIREIGTPPPQEGDPVRTFLRSAQEWSDHELMASVIADDIETAFENMMPTLREMIESGAMTSVQVEGAVNRELATYDQICSTLAEARTAAATTVGKQLEHIPTLVKSVGKDNVHAVYGARKQIVDTMLASADNARQRSVALRQEVLDVLRAAKPPARVVQDTLTSPVQLPPDGTTTPAVSEPNGGGSPQPDAPTIALRIATIGKPRKQDGKAEARSRRAVHTGPSTASTSTLSTTGMPSTSSSSSVASSTPRTRRAASHRVTPSTRKPVPLDPRTVQLDRFKHGIKALGRLGYEWKRIKGDHHVFTQQGMPSYVMSGVRLPSQALSKAQEKRLRKDLLDLQITAKGKKK